MMCFTWKPGAEKMVEGVMPAALCSARNALPSSLWARQAAPLPASLESKGPPLEALHFQQMCLLDQLGKSRTEL